LFSRLFLSFIEGLLGMAMVGGAALVAAGAVLAGMALAKK